MCFWSRYSLSLWQWCCLLRIWIVQRRCKHRTIARNIPDLWRLRSHKILPIPQTGHWGYIHSLHFFISPYWPHGTRLSVSACKLLEHMSWDLIYWLVRLLVRTTHLCNASHSIYSISQEICTRFLLCCALLWLYIDWFSHIHQAYFTGTVAIWRLPQCQQSNPDEYG